MLRKIEKPVSGSFRNLNCNYAWHVRALNVEVMIISGVQSTHCTQESGDNLFALVCVLLEYFNYIIFIVASVVSH